jgi:ELWxxDGT repeat protein
MQTEPNMLRQPSGDFMTSRTVLAGLVAATLSAAAGLAQPASLVADLATGAGTPVGSAPEQITPLGNGRIVFVADEPGSGREVWTSDGTAAGTSVLRNINPDGGSHPSALAVLGDRLYFSAFDPIRGFELWSSDGTSNGTHLVQDIVPGPLSSAPDWLTAVGGRLYFTADDGITGRELWTVSPGVP